MSSSDRMIPNLRARRVLAAVREVMGPNGLNIILRRASLERFINQLPPANREPGMRPEEFAALNQAIQEYYGTGARGTLNRIGRLVFAQSTQDRKLGGTLEGLLGQLLPTQLRLRRALARLAAQMAAPGGNVSVYLDDQRLIVVDRSSDATAGRGSETPVCHLTVGEIQAAAHRATGREFNVVETACKAKGDPACSFEIGESLG